MLRKRRKTLGNVDRKTSGNGGKLGCLLRQFTETWANMYSLNFIKSFVFKICIVPFKSLALHSWSLKSLALNIFSWFLTTWCWPWMVLFCQAFKSPSIKVSFLVLVLKCLKSFKVFLQCSKPALFVRDG